MFIYTYACHETESALCELELRTLLGQPIQGGAVISDIAISQDRSPFVKRRICVIAAADSLEELIIKLSGVELNGRTFKVLFTSAEKSFTYEEQRQLERAAGAAIRGKAVMRTPELLFGLLKLKEKWYFGPCEENHAVWLKHQSKPQNYSTALPARTARAIVNIAAGPAIEHISMIDPCCGMGTVLIEAMSMGISIEGVELNPLAVRGARVNLAHFGYPDRVKREDMRLIRDSYDAAIVDLPYNLCSILPKDEQQAMLEAVRRFAKRAVIVTTEPIPHQLEMAAWRVAECIALSKASFTRYISVVE
ncbi:TRM11 family SAM-dependent methyltransferase [Paenibacillus sp. sgz302251]|uniref:TRM11 family SAM-dependent methyltransferase n=1 Tax=Paenibacillus sp. sgz302251 TaxID=3414493 RepID=UPI003C799DAD